VVIGSANGERYLEIAFYDVGSWGWKLGGGVWFGLRTYRFFFFFECPSSLRGGSCPWASPGTTNDDSNGTFGGGGSSKRLAAEVTPSRRIWIEASMTPVRRGVSASGRYDQKERRVTGPGRDKGHGRVSIR